MPMYLLLNKYNAFVRICFSKNSEAELKQTIEQADIVISACGVPGIVKAEWIKQDSIVIDVGINYVTDQNGNSVITGDVEFNELTL